MHYTSVLGYPVLKKHKDYPGDTRILERPFLHRMINDHLPAVLRRFPNALIVPFGERAQIVIEAVATEGGVDRDRVLGGILHPSGHQWNRYNVQLGLVDEATAVALPDGEKVRRRSEALKNQVRDILARRQAT